ncbi:ChaN family lipoprotein [Pelosinus fermentans]|uniref:Haem-binding uptake Tiki superfamily ChaN domain-containing protein n=1 Tax=Pelosinus fermentans JBW45 TaxID=1192197 RepID=I8TV77_9FIRM|nr:ChaN family lipoprotein [Pelosinus fermentans]AJQ26560.1 protein of unknown function DUF399 [Pelosinus fermentans JBW45]
MKLMMRSITLLIAIWMTFFSVLVEANSADYQCYETVSGKAVSVDDVSQLFRDYNVMIFGEYHDNQALHRLEEELLRTVYAQHSALTISLEMFERDVQQPLNDYLASDITETAFLAQSRPWPNYQSDYRPLVEFAKKEGLQVLAANIPRPMASHYARQSSLEGIDETMRQYLPAVHRTPDGEYKRRFFTQMQSVKAMPKEQMEAFYRAQCLKDNTMAESIVEHYRHYPDRKIIHYQGDFHGRYRLGVVEKLQALEPSLRILVITPVLVDDFGDGAVKARNLQADGDIVVFVKRTTL